MLRKNFTIGKYTTTSAEPIGVGSFASVYVARHVESSVSVAIKVVDLQRLKAINSKLMTHLQSEIDVMRGLRHRNIVRLFDIAMEEPNLYMVLEMCRFGDMSKHVQAQPTGRLDEQRARFFAMQLRDGLAFLHERRIIHRDLKPQNLLLAEPLRGTASDAFVLKIADFGFAREMRDQMAETMCGSPLFMAVEILRGERYTESADLWSTGAILYYLLTGQPPFKADTAHQLHRMIESTAVSLPNDVRVSGDAAQLVYALLQKQPASRLSWQAFAAHPWLTARPLPHDAAYHVIVQSDNNNNSSSNNSISSSTDNSQIMRSSEPPVSPTALHADARPFTAADHSPLRRRPRAATSPSLGIHPLPIANRRLTGVDLAASEFLTDAVVVMSEDELVHDIERRRDRANAVAEQARALLDLHPNNALMLYVAALVSLRDALQQASAAAIHLSARASHSPRDTGSSPIDSGQPIRVSIALGALRHAVRDVLRDGLGARDDVAASLRRSAEARPAIGVDSAPQIGLSGECAELIFKRAMSAGRAAAAAELEQVYGKSARLYLKGVLLLEFLLDSAHDETDKTVLNQYKSLFEQRLFVTETYNQ